MSPTILYTTTIVPKPLTPSDAATFAAKLRAFKLNALQCDPKAFSQEYAIEAALPLSVWESRITNPGSHIVVCTALPGPKQSISTTGHNDAKSQILDGEWVGMFTIVGPVAQDAWCFPESRQPNPGNDAEELRWQLTGLFVLPSHRGKGLAKKIILAALDFCRNSALESAMLPSSTTQTRVQDQEGHSEKSSAITKRARVRLIVHPDNKDVVDMYLKLGFVDCARYTLREAYIANGDAAFIPQNASEGKWDARFGIGMEYLA